MKHLLGLGIYLFFLLTILWSGFTQAQNLTFEHLSTNQGLSHSNVSHMLQDKEGFMWFGSGYGLNKYDGYTFTVFKYDPNDPTHTMQGTSPRAIHEDKEGNLWVATWGGGGLNKVDKQIGNIIPIVNRPAAVFLSLCEDRQGFFWIGTNRGLVRFNPKTEEFTPYTIAKAAYAVAEDASGRLWMFSNQIFTFDRHTYQYTLFPQPIFTDSSFNFIAAHLDKEGVLWIGTNGKGLVTLNTKKSPLQPTPYNPGGLINQTINDHGIYEDAEGFLWLATTEGLQRINKKTNQVITYRSDPTIPGTLSSNNVKSVYKGREGTLWVGTDNGINKAIAHPKPFNAFRVKTTSLPVLLTENKIQTILEDRSGMVWLGNQITGLYQFNPQSRQIKHIAANPADPHSLSSEGVRLIYEDRWGRLWVSTKEALHRLDRSGEKFIRYSTKFPVISMDEDPSGKLWIAAKVDPGHGAIAYLDSATSQFRYYYRSDNGKGLNRNDIYALMASRTGDIWISSVGGGLNRLNPKTGKFTYYTPDYPFTKGHLNDFGAVALYEDPQSIIWVGTSKSGLNRFDPQTNTFTYFTSKEGLASNQVISIIGDSRGNLWLGTYGGISRFNPITKTFRNFDVRDGLPNNEFFIGSVYSHKNKLLFGSSNGFVIFHPDSIKDNSTPPPVYITGLKVLEKNRPLPKGRLELSHQENFLSFDFVTLNYDAPEKNQYAYQLVGLDKDWIHSGTRRYASYPGLASGTYTFRVKASNNDGIWNEKGTSVRVIIHPPFWRTTWAYLLYGVCFIAGLVAIDRYQRRRVIEKEREKARERELAQAREIEKANKQLGQQKEELQATLEDLQATQSQLIQKEKMASLGEITAGIAHEIQNPLNFVNNFSEVSQELCGEIEQETKEGNTQEVLSITADLKQNLEKIHHHGKRADSIVKGMLEHSRASAGEKQPTDINALVDEYLRLSYHGIKAKNKDFNANLLTDFDPHLGKLEVVPQEIGRVLLNLFNNAFYATAQKKTQLNGQYQPQVIVSTKVVRDNVEIRVKDNGVGIPDHIRYKIFQPFFTTKPTGEGTGLGLSLSYDIITKGHGGQLKVEPKEEGAEFIITLPIR